MRPCWRLRGLLAALAPLVFSLLPALQVSRASLRESLTGGRTVRAALRARTRAALVIGQIALALMLLVGCTLLVRSFARLLDVDPGFNPGHAVAVGLQLPAQNTPTQADRVRFQTMLIDQLAARPGVTAVGVSQSLPLGGNDFVASLEFEGRPTSKARPPERELIRGEPGLLHGDGHPRRTRARHRGSRSGRRAACRRGQRDLRAAVLSGPGSDRPAHPRHAGRGRTARDRRDRRRHQALRAVGARHEHRSTSPISSSRFRRSRSSCARRVIRCRSRVLCARACVGWIPISRSAGSVRWNRWSTSRLDRSASRWRSSARSPVSRCCWPRSACTGWSPIP